MGIPSENDSLNVYFVHMPTVKSNFWTFISKKRALYGRVHADHTKVAFDKTNYEMFLQGFKITTETPTMTLICDRCVCKLRLICTRSSLCRLTIGALLNQDKFDGTAAPEDTGQRIEIGIKKYNPVETGGLTVRIEQHAVSPYFDLDRNV